VNAILDDPRYPIGRFDARATTSDAELPGLIDQIAAAPAALRAAVDGLDERQLETPYREGGWTVRQVVHHVPDSHMNALIRFKLGLTEDAPTIKTYDEKAWAELADARETPIVVSLALLDAVHDRWLRVLRAMQPADFDRPLRHPEWGDVDLRMVTRLYAWHGRHHVAHINRLRERQGW
jgi:uncharacterized damage-inducible protein DinB